MGGGWYVAIAMIIAVTNIFKSELFDDTEFQMINVLFKTNSKHKLFDGSK